MSSINLIYSASSKTVNLNNIPNVLPSSKVINTFAANTFQIIQRFYVSIHYVITKTMVLASRVCELSYANLMYFLNSSSSPSILIYKAIIYALVAYGAYLLVKKIITEWIPKVWNRVFARSDDMVAGSSPFAFPLRSTRLNPTVTPLQILDAPQSDQLIRIAEDVRLGGMVEPFTEISRFLAAGDLQARHQFVEEFSRNLPNYGAVRTYFQNSLFQTLQRVTGAGEFPIQWLSQEEINESAATILGDPTDPCLNEGRFYHSTDAEGIEGILRSSEIRVMLRPGLHYRRGAFVSSAFPERGARFNRENPYILVMKRNIQYLSTLLNGLYYSQRTAADGTLYSATHWIGFSQPIPVRDDTLAYVILRERGATEEDRVRFERQCTEWAGRPVKAFLYSDVHDRMELIWNLNLGMPIDWNLAAVF